MKFGKQQKDESRRGAFSLVSYTQAETLASTRGVWLDKKGRKLLMTLIVDATTSLVSIGRSLGLVPHAVSYRIDRMAEAGLIERTVAKVNRRILGYTEVDFIQVKATKIVDLEALTKLRGVLAVYQGRTGSDFLIAITSCNFEDNQVVTAGIALATGDQQPTELFRGSVLHEDYEGGNVFRHVYNDEVKPVAEKPEKRTVEAELPRVA